MDIDNKVKYLEGRIKELVSLAEDAKFRHVENYDCDGCINLAIERDFHNLIKLIYHHVVAYLDFHQLDNYLELFYQTFGKKPEEAIIEMSSFIGFDEFTGDPAIEFLVEIKDFLSCFPFMDDQFHYLDIMYLERILKNTAVIIEQNKKLLGVNYPKKETDVYNAVKVTLSSIFPDSKNPTSNFIKTAKSYKPDILIPELHTAIEYKFATDAQTLKNTVEGIIVDAQGYTGDTNYNRFYAVFYVTSDFWGEEKFRNVWDEYKIPKNWKAFYIVGNSSENN